MSATANFVGGGNMASAILGSAAFTKDWAAANVAIADPDTATRDRHASNGHPVLPSPAELPEAGTCFLCVKPQDMHTACTDLLAGGSITAETTVISIAAGISTGDLANWLDNKGRFVRTMPNTPLLVGQGCTFAYTEHPHDGPAGTVTQRVFAGCGEFFWVAREALLDAATALSGSGPAYAYLVIETMARVAAEMGLPPQEALAAATATVSGAATLVGSSATNPATLREQVTSKGGTTAAALAVLEEQGFAAALAAAMQAAAQRSQELSQGKN